MRSDENRIKIMFICHGNICRSPMAEFIFKYLAEKKGLSDKYLVSSSATSTEEIGNPIHYGAKRIMTEKGIPFSERRARQITKKECDEFDYLICMDRMNHRNMAPFIGENGKKLFLMMKFAGTDKDVSDPWWTGNFEEPFEDILSGCKGLLSFLESTKQ